MFVLGYVDVFGFISLRNGFNYWLFAVTLVIGVIILLYIVFFFVCEVFFGSVLYIGADCVFLLVRAFYLRCRN